LPDWGEIYAEIIDGGSSGGNQQKKKKGLARLFGKS